MEEEKRIEETKEAIENTEKLISSIGINDPKNLSDALQKQVGITDVSVTGEYLEITYDSGIKQSIILLTESNPLKQLRGAEDSTEEVKLYSEGKKSKNETFFLDQNLLDMRKEYEKYNEDDNCAEVKTRKILLWAPMDSEWGENDEIEAMKAIVAQEDNLDLDLEIVSDEKASADVLKNMNKYGIVILSTHGHNGNWLMTGEKYNPNKIAVKDTKALLEGQKQIITLRKANKSEQYFAITAKWLEQNITKKLPGTIIYNNSCGSLKTDITWKVLEKKGASTYLGYTGNVRNEFAILNLTMFFNSFIAERQSAFCASSFLTDCYHNDTGSSFSAAGQGNYKIAQEIKQSNIKKVEFPKQKEIKIITPTQSNNAKIGFALPGIVQVALDAIIAAIGTASAVEMAILIGAFAVVAIAYDVVTSVNWKAVKQYVQSKSIAVWQQIEETVQVIQAKNTYKATTKEERDYVLCQVETKKNERKTILCNTKYHYSSFKKQFIFDVKLRLSTPTTPPKVSLDIVLERADSKYGTYKVVKRESVPLVDFKKTYKLSYSRKTGHYRLSCNVKSSSDTIVIQKPYDYYCINRTGHVWKWNITHSLSKKSVSEPVANYKKVKVSKKDRKFNYRELYINKYQSLYGQIYDDKYFSKYQIHHIQPLHYKGENKYYNLIHLTKIQHTPITSWFAGY